MIKTAEHNGDASPSGGPPLVESHNIYKTYHVGEVAVPAVRGVSLVVHRGQFVAIMGQSGSGKSTLMHILGCLDQCDRGEYRLDGVDMTRMSKRELARQRNRKIGFVFQTFNLLSRTTVLDNVAMPLAYAHVRRKERRRRAAELLDQVGLADRAMHHSNQLSGGQQQRVAIARALITSPVLLLADEPTGNLDSRTGIDIMALLQHLNRDSGVTILLVTHEVGIAQFTRRIVALRDGRIDFDRPNESMGDAAKAVERMLAAADA